MFITNFKVFPITIMDVCLICKSDIALNHIRGADVYFCSIVNVCINTILYDRYSIFFAEKGFLDFSSYTCSKQLSTTCNQIDKRSILRVHNGHNSAFNTIRHHIASEFTMSPIRYNIISIFAAVCISN
jgi:hypothetical protein